MESAVEAQLELARVKCVEALNLLESGRVAEAGVAASETALAAKAALETHLRLAPVLDLAYALIEGNLRLQEHCVD